MDSIDGIGRPEGEGDRIKDIVKFRIVRKFAMGQSFVREGKQEVMECRLFRWPGGLNTNP